MLSYIIRRIAAMFPVLAFVAVFVFLLIHITPVDPAAIIAGDYATLDQIAAIRTQLKLDRPLLEQFTTWVNRLVRADLGVSIFSQQPVARLIGQRLEPTLILALMATSMAVIIAVPLGVIAAYYGGGVFDRLVVGFSVLGFSTPIFLVGYFLVYVFALGLDWFPAQGYSPLSAGLGFCLRSLLLPALAVALLYVALITRVTRAVCIEVLNQDYVRTAQAKGLESWVVLRRHVLPNAAVPIATVVGIGIAAMLGGVVVTETVFNIPGLGRLTADAIVRRDFPIIQGLMLLFTGIYVGVNLLIDLSYVFFDPRIRY
jgi:peptide/nickel transport system permease protein